LLSLLKLSLPLLPLPIGIRPVFLPHFFFFFIVVLIVFVDGIKVSLFHVSLKTRPLIVMAVLAINFHESNLTLRAIFFHPWLLLFDLFGGDVAAEDLFHVIGHVPLAFNSF
jgi:hypothetical protein